MKKIKEKKLPTTELELPLEDKCGNSINHYYISQEPLRKIFGTRSKNPLLPERVPVFNWKEANPDVPKIDPSYVFEGESLGKVLLALLNNERCWISGETGTGKSTLIEQIAARLNYPVFKINFDSEITRSDLIGRDVLKSKDGNTVSEFVEGVLPRAISGPNIILFDEIDFIRPDVVYVLQSFLDGSNLRINEDGGRIVETHNQCRVFATANTTGQGDLTARYIGARAQSCALRDRFGIWIHKSYLPANQEINLLKDRGVGFLSKNTEESMKQYIMEHRRGFSKSDVSIPLSPRSIKSAGFIYESLKNKSDDITAIKKALEMTVIDQCNPQDKRTLNGLVQRVFEKKLETKSKLKTKSLKSDPVTMIKAISRIF
tara:strand:+ start:1649 stop:2770 length:1122 start_codon:yes stop_codon:yes gene_type:complete